MRTARRVRRDVTGAGLLLLALALGCGEGGLFGSAFIRVASPNGGNSEYFSARKNGETASVNAGRIILTFMGFPLFRFQRPGR